MKYVKLTVTERIRSGVQKRSLANITPSSVKRASDVNITRGLRLQLLKLRQRSLRQKTVFTRYVFDWLILLRHHLPEAYWTFLSFSIEWKVMRKCFGIAFLRCVIDGDTWIDRHFHKEIRKLQEGTFGKKSTLSIVCVQHISWMNHVQLFTKHINNENISTVKMILWRLNTFWNSTSSGWKKDKMI